VQVIFECSIACWLLLLLLFCLAGAYESRQLNVCMVRRLQGGSDHCCQHHCCQPPPFKRLQAALPYAQLLFGVAAQPVAVSMTPRWARQWIPIAIADIWWPIYLHVPNATKNKEKECMLASADRICQQMLASVAWSALTMLRCLC
jgi:hypothetical protein